MPKPKVKPMSVGKANYVQSAGTVGIRYESGILNGKPWQANATSEGAESRFNTKMQDALARKLRLKGCSRTTEEGWKNPALTKGKQLIGPAMTMSVDKWVAKTQPFTDAVANVEMAERTTDANTNIDGRLKPIVAAQQAKKRELEG